MCPVAALMIMPVPYSKTYGSKHRDTGIFREYILPGNTERMKIKMTRIVPE